MIDVYTSERSDWWLATQPGPEEPSPTMKQRVLAWENVAFAEPIAIYDAVEPLRAALRQKRTVVWRAHRGRGRRALLDSLSDEQIVMISEVFDRAGAATPDPNVFGELVSDQDGLVAAFWHSKAAHQRLKVAAANSIDAAQATTNMGLTDESLRCEIEHGSVSVLVFSGKTLLPRWQFGSDGRRLPGVRDIVANWMGSPEALAEWMERENPQLGSRTPLDLLRDGQVDEVVGLARRSTLVS